MATDWYTDHLYKIYDGKFLEKFFRKSPLKQWVGWYNRYNGSFNYEVYNTVTGNYNRRIVPRKFPYVSEFSFIDNEDFFNTGLCIYRQGDTVYWYSIIFGTDLSNQDDKFWTEPVSYINHCYYLYVHDVKHPWNNSRLVYLFVDTGTIQVYVIDTSNPGVLNKIDMSEVTDWCADLCATPDVDLRLSRTAIEFDGKHRAFYMTGADTFPTHGPTRIFTIDTVYTEDFDSLVFKANMVGNIWYSNNTGAGSYPPFDLIDIEHNVTYLTNHKYLGAWASGLSYEINQVVYYGSNNYVCTSAHTSSASNHPGASSAPWSTLYYPIPFGTVGYTYGLKIFPTNTLDYEYVNWRTDADREWLVGYNQIVVRTAGGFAYILLG